MAWSYWLEKTTKLQISLLAILTIKCSAILDALQYINQAGNIHKIEPGILPAT